MSSWHIELVLPLSLPAPPVPLCLSYMPWGCKWLAQLKQDLTVPGGLPITTTPHAAWDQGITLLLTVLRDPWAPGPSARGGQGSQTSSRSPTAAGLLPWCSRARHMVTGRHLGVSGHWCQSLWIWEKGQHRHKGERPYFELMYCSLFLKRK